MSAAEKLKGLDTLTLKNEHNVPIRSLTVAEQLVDALPQIVAVVEALERVLKPWEKVKNPAVDEALAFARDALAALDEQLQDLSSPSSSERTTAP